MNTPTWLEWAQRLQAVAQNGLTYCKDSFGIERYQAIEQIAAEIMSAGAGDHSLEAIRGLFDAQSGYATPKVDLRAAVIHEDKILLVREREDGCWSMPGGWADVGSAPSENVLREVREESGYEAEIVKLAAFYDRDLHGHPPIPFYTYKVFFLCRLVGGEAAHSNETDGVAFFGEDEIPEMSLTRVTPDEVKLMFEHHRHPEWLAPFD